MTEDALTPGTDADSSARNPEPTSGEGGKPRRIKVAIVSHAYIALENRKNISELLKFADVEVAMPRDMSNTVLIGWLDERGRRRRTAGSGPAVAESGLDREGAGPYRPYRRIRLFGAQYFLASWTLGLRRFDPDIVHVDFDPWATIFQQAALAKRLFAPRAKLVVTSRKNTYRKYPGTLGQAKHQLAMSGVRQVDHVHAESNRVAELYMDRFGLSEDQISVWPQIGVDLSVFRPVDAPLAKPAGPLIVGFVGRFDDDKGILDMVEAFAKVRARTHADIELHCLGSGTRLGELEARANRDSWLKLFPRVPHDKVFEFFRGLGVYVMPSRITPDHEEHDAHALIEAMSFGIPSIGSRCGIIPEILGDGSGLLCDPADPESLAEPLEQLVRNEPLREELRQRGLAKARREFSLEAVAACRIELYERLLRTD